MTLIEGMASGGVAPVVGSRVERDTLVIDDGVDGLLVRPADPAQLAWACDRTPPGW